MELPAFFHTVAATLAAEFADVDDVAAVTRLVFRLGLAMLLGGLLGLQRERHGKAAGVRTHMLVSMGSALFVLIPLQFGATPDGLARVVQGLVAGVGFLGAGTILKPEAEARVKGLTTAAGIWLTAAVGVAAGTGRETTAVISTLLALVVFALMPKLATKHSGDDD